ncbi:glucokinase [Synechococcus sp. CS-1324]|uniref:glucokinase n=1 Tax=Synechococcus sp. CS-1324 TaxID=2847980 RepID=UPI00223BCAB4|nr:glucokinase [Synechococcus sp. CS-1324]MCT0229399.1 glucokinase [Synechococcus sp. CS-1324]
MTTLLAGDIGGTKTLLATYRLQAGQLELQRRHRYPSAGWSDFAALVSHFLAAEPELESPRHGCLAVAGPVLNGQVKVTNLPWSLDQAELSSACGLEALELVNDFAVLIYGLPHLAADQQQPLRPDPPTLGSGESGGPLAILGAGTGLGTAIGVPGPGGLIALASEAAHAEFAPRNEPEWRLKQWLAANLGLERVSVERVVSGTGLGHLTRWLLAEQDPGAAHPLAGAARHWADPATAERPDLPALVAAAAEQGDPLASAALQLWLGAYGSAAGDLALQCLCRGGLWLGGGTAGKLLHHLRSEAFLLPFGAKGRLSPLLAAIPLWAIVDPDVGLFSAACRARMLLEGAATTS